MKILSTVIVITVGLVTTCLKSDDDISKLQEKSRISCLIAQRFLQERAKKTRCNQTDDKIFKDLPCEIHDMSISAELEECDSQKSVIVKTKVFGTVDDFEDANVIEAEKRVLKFVLINAYKTALAQNKESLVTLPLDANTKVIIKPNFVVIYKDAFLALPGFNTTISKDRKGMQLLTVFSKAEFDALKKTIF